jgi:NAD(P)-dependent dehydrogenase (short-subunit alcohol dehydrogenase family)
MPEPPPVTIVTGAAGALGQAVTAGLVRSGHRVAAVDLEQNRLESLAAEFPDAVLPVFLNAGAPGVWAAALSAITTRFGGYSGLVLTAGGWTGGTPVAEETDDHAFRRMMELNLETARGAIAAVLPGMVARRHGSIVVVGSRAVERPWESSGAAAYAAAKSALVAYARAVAAEVLYEGVRVNAVMPSVIDTPANRAAMPDAEPNRWVSPERLAKVIAFLLSDDAADISGAAIPVYGRA